jgi:hypothetical protein
MWTSGWGTLDCVASWPGCVGDSIIGLDRVSGVEKDKDVQYLDAPGHESYDGGRTS